jgi:sugar phosphate isomerase/epimerase
MSLGDKVKGRLCAPLPAANWQETLGAVRSLGLRAVELESDWLDDACLADGVAAIREQGVLPLALQVSFAQLEGTEPSRLERLSGLGLQYLIVRSCQRSDSELDRLNARAGRLGLTALLENDPYRWPADGPSLGRAASDPRRPHVRACYKPAGAVALRRHPFLADMMPGPLKRAVRIVRLADALFADGSQVLPDQGNAELREIVSALECRGYQGWYSLHPFGSGDYPERLARAHAAVTRMLDEL